MKQSKIWLFMFIAFITFNSYLLAEENQRTIKVTGNSNVLVSPDNVTIHFQIDVLNKDLKLAKDKSNEIFSDIMVVADKFKLNHNQIKTNYFTIYPKYGYDNVFLGYQVTKAIAFRLDDLTKFEELTSSLLVSGVERIIRINFDVVDSRKYRDQTRGEALKAAKEKAVAMADQYGKQVGDPISIIEESDGGTHWNSPNPFNSTAYTVGSSVLSEGIAYGQNSISSKVTVVFELK